MFIFKFLTSNFYFSEKHIFRKQKRTAVYGRASLVSDFNLTLENDGISKYRYTDTDKIFEVPFPVHEYTKMQIPNKRYQTNTVRTF